MVYFVYRSVYEGPSGRLVRHFPDATVLDWFRRVWDDAASQDAYKWVERELGANVYGLHTIFETGLPAPRTHGELRRILKEHLYVERTLRVDRHSVRVLTPPSTAWGVHGRMRSRAYGCRGSRRPCARRIPMSCPASCVPCAH
ncbi:hypothetical protein [Microbispora rosea]|uniref:hypothetical protein n=1 Tax=Microbispora rosea TaxID=58117 RepID=UPI003D8E2908